MDAKITYSGDDEIFALANRIRKAVRKSDKTIERSLKRLSKEIPARIRRTVETTPSALVPGKDNRVWTGHMRDSASAVILGPTIEYGWIDGLGDYDGGFDRYIATQEYGGGRVWGMNALRAVQEYIEDNDATAYAVHDLLEGVFK